MMKVIAIRNATSEELKKHYGKCSPISLEFDRIRPNYYEQRPPFKVIDPMMEHYRVFLIKMGIRKIAIGD